MRPWADAWRGIFGFSDVVPEWVIAVLCIFAVYACVVIPAGAVVSYLDRKLGADFQARIGPNRAGPFGILQPLADFLKLIQKEGESGDAKGGRLWVVVHTMALYSTLAILPLGSLMLFLDADMSAFMPLLAALILSLSLMLIGINQGSVSGWLGGMRVAAQALAGFFPAVVALLCVGIRSGGYSWRAVMHSQGASPLAWTAFSDPFELVAFIVFLVSGLVLFCAAPMDGGVFGTDIHGGALSRLSGRQLNLFRLGRFYGFFLWSVVTVSLFLGGWNLPTEITDFFSGAEGWRVIVDLGCVLSKTLFLMLLVIWVSRVNPRSRVDQVTDFAWKVLSPFALVALIGETLWAGFGALR